MDLSFFIQFGWIEGELLPEATLDVQYSQRFGLSNTLKEQQVTNVMARVNVPLYRGGGPGGGRKAPCTPR